MITEKTIDLLTTECDIIAHQTNCRGIMGAGVARQIRDKLLSPEKYAAYVSLCKESSSELLGTVQYLPANNGKTIANLFGEDIPTGVSLDTDYDALRRALESLESYAQQHHLSVAVPGYIGCGLAGGDWKIVSKMIYDIFSDSNVPLEICFFTKTLTKDSLENLVGAYRKGRIYMGMKPILFNTKMVKAILKGEKSVTRRAIKLPRHISIQANGLYEVYSDGICYKDKHFRDIVKSLKAPYKVGDILYVRETWNEWEGGYVYKAWASPFRQAGNYGQWKPSIHMPKEAARVFLKVTNIRIERLQNVCDEGSLQERVTNMTKEGLHLQQVLENYERLVDDFKELWDSTIKKDQLWQYGWKANPYVWVIEFERCEKPGK